MGSQSAFSTGPISQRRHRRKNKETFNTYIYKLLKTIHPSLGVSKQAMTVLNSFVFDFFHRICKECKNLLEFCYKLSLSEKEVQTATTLILCNELGKHAISMIIEAITKYQSTLGSGGSY